MFTCPDIVILHTDLSETLIDRIKWIIYLLNGMFFPVLYSSWMGGMEVLFIIPFKQMWCNHQRCRSPWMIPHHVNNRVDCAKINPVQCHLGSLAARSLRMVCTTSAHPHQQCLHRFGQFNVLSGHISLNKILLFQYFSDLKGMINLLLGSL